MRHLGLGAGAAVLLALAAACGGGGGGGGGGASQPAGSTKVVMTDFKFTPSDLNVKSGKAVFFLVNSGSSSHDFVVLNPSQKPIARSPLLQPGQSTTFTVDNLAAGSYKVICDQPGHEEAGMKGTLVAS